MVVAPLGDLDPAVVMVDGIHFRDRVILVALGIYAQGNKHVLGLREGSTESTRVVRSLLSDLVDRGLDADRARLWVIDGCKALRKAIVECFGATALVQRCQEHKRRNVLDHLPEELHASRAARPSRHADIGRRVEQARRRRPTRRTQGRVGSPMRSRHPASFNTERDIASSLGGAEKAAPSFDGWSAMVVWNGREAATPLAHLYDSSRLDINFLQPNQ